MLASGVMVTWVRKKKITINKKKIYTPIQTDLHLALYSGTISNENG